MDFQEIVLKFKKYCSGYWEYLLCVPISFLYTTVKIPPYKISPLDIVTSEDLYTSAPTIAREVTISDIILCSRDPRRLLGVVIEEKESYWRDFFTLMIYLHSNQDCSLIKRCWLRYIEDLELILDGNGTPSVEALDFVMSFYH